MVAQGLRHELPYREHEYQAMPAWKDIPRTGHEVATRLGRTPEEFPFWLLTSHTMQDSWGSSVSLPVLADVARPANGHFDVMLNRGAAQRLGIGEGDVIEIEAATGRTEGRAVLREGVRPDVAVILQPLGHRATPFARDLAMPNLNQVATMDLELTDATGSGADWVPVAIRKASRPAARRDAAARDGAAVLRWTSPWLAGRCDLRERCAIDEAYIRGL
jgi:phenylacetyl-CoA:acceptor oxidoreductase